MVNSSVNRPASQAEVGALVDDRLLVEIEASAIVTGIMRQ